MPIFGTRRRRRDRSPIRPPPRLYRENYDRDDDRERINRARYPSHPTDHAPRARSPRPYAQMPARAVYPPAVNAGGEPGAGRPILGSQYVAGLPLRRASELPNDRQTCGTCLEEYADEQDDVAIVQLPCCSNSIHRDCILDWVGETKANNNTCPFCRHELFTRSHYNGRDLELEDLQDLEPDDLQDLPPPQNLPGYDYDPDIEEFDIPMNNNRFDRPAPQGANVSLHDARFDFQRLQLAENRRQGALKDRRLYQQLLADGARLAGNLPPDAHVLNLEQDRAMFEELRRRGAFTQPGMVAGYRNMEDHFSDTAIYEDQRNRGRWWSQEPRRWHEKDGRPVTHFDDID